MRCSFKLKDLLVILFLVGVIATGVHFWISDRLGVLRAIYPLQVPVAQWQQQCSVDAPVWMADVLSYAIKNNGALANQLAYVASDGVLSHCESGWQGSMLRSPRVVATTRFRYASVTKLFTADAILSLVRQGQLNPDTTLVDVFPELAAAKDERLQRITMAMLLRHTAGFDRLETEDPLFSRRGNPWCPYNLGELLDITLDFTPDDRYSYSNVGYCLLGQVLERVTGQSFRDYLIETYQLQGLGIEFVDGPYKKDEVVYDFRNNNFYQANYHRFFDFDALSSVAGLSGSASALAVSVKRILNETSVNVLSGDVLASCDRSDFRQCYGYSVYTYQEQGKDFQVFMNEGYLPAASSVVFADDAGGVLVLLTGGGPLDGYEQKAKMYRYIYQTLYNYYER